MNVGDKQKCEHYSGEQSKDWRIRASEFLVSDGSRTNTHDSIDLDMGSYCLNPLCQGKNTKIINYYNKQNEILQEMIGLDGMHEISPQAVKELPEDDTSKREQFAIRISNYVNMVLLAMKVFVSIKSVSLAIIASTLDSLLDLLSGFILWYTSYKMRRPNPYHYPIGKNRMQPVGILVFASIMATLGMQILIESVRQLISKSSHIDLEGQNKFWVIGVMVFAIVVKFILVLLCKTLKNEIVQAYAKDHFFDVITNSIGLITAILAQRFFWWIDPTGAILLALYTIWNWTQTMLENVASLVGETAPPEFLQKITYLCWNHHKAIKHIDTIKSYKFGGYYFTEVDIVLPSNMPLHDAHDIGESLQNKLECLPEIERAFVHLDYEFSHRPEHEQKC